jgi:hypothetical protein
MEEPLNTSFTDRSNSSRSGPVSASPVACAANGSPLASNPLLLHEYHGLSVVSNEIHLGYVGLHNHWRPETVSHRYNGGGTNRYLPGTLKDGAYCPSGAAGIGEGSFSSTAFASGAGGAVDCASPSPKIVAPGPEVCSAV